MGETPSRLQALAATALVLAWAGAAGAGGLRVSCHIHPPAELVERGEAPATIGPFGDNARCETERSERYGSDGRCHCTASFAGPGVLGPRSEPSPRGVDLGEPPLP